MEHGFNVHKKGMVINPVGRIDITHHVCVSLK